MIRTVCRQQNAAGGPSLFRREGKVADTPITAAELGDKVDWQQTEKPRSMSGTFDGDDTDYHAMELNMRVQSGLMYGAYNPANTDLTLTLYGTLASGKDVATDDDVFLIEDSELIVAAGETAYEVTGDKFLYYIIRCNFPVVPTDSPAEEVSVFAESRES